MYVRVCVCLWYYHANVLEKAAASSLLSLFYTLVAKGSVHLVSLGNTLATLANGNCKSPPEDLGVSGSVFYPQAMTMYTRLTAMNTAIEKLPAWQNKATVKSSMNAKKLRSKTEGEF